MSSLRVCVFVALCAAAVMAAPPNPQISSTFMSGVIITDVWWQPHLPGQLIGFMATDAAAQNTIFSANESFVDVNILKLYPAAMQYQYIPQQQQCSPSKINETYFAWFSWLQYGSDQGQTVVQETITDVWTLTTSDGSLLALYNVGNTPVRFVTSSTSSKITSVIDFYDFQPQQPPSNLFSIPSYCVEAPHHSKVHAEAELLDRVLTNVNAAVGSAFDAEYDD